MVDLLTFYYKTWTALQQDDDDTLSKKVRSDNGVEESGV